MSKLSTLNKQLTRLKAKERKKKRAEEKAKKLADTKKEIDRIKKYLAK